jgi:hypothetical protein
VVWILARQLRTVVVRDRLLVAVPLVLGWAGLRGLHPATLAGGADGVLLATSALASVGLGWWRGLTLRVWREDGVWLRRGTPVTLLLWVALFAVRGVLAVIGRLGGHPETTDVSVLLCCLALSFAAQNAVTLTRIGGLAPSPRRSLPSRRRSRRSSTATGVTGSSTAGSTAAR